MEIDATFLCLVSLLIHITRKRKSRQRNRRIWTRSWLLKRHQLGAYHRLIPELTLTDPESLRNFIRMDLSTFEDLLRLVSRRIAHGSTNFRSTISARERLIVTLRFLATGRLFLIQCCFNISEKPLTLGRPFPYHKVSHLVDHPPPP